MKLNHVFVLLVGLVIVGGCISQSKDKPQNIYGGPIQAAPCLASEKKQVTGEFSHFVDADTGLEFDYLPEWRSERTYGGDAVYRFTEKARPTLRVTKYPALDDGGLQLTLETFTSYRINKRLKYDSGIFDDLFDESCSTTFAGNPAHKVVYKNYLDASRPDSVVKSMEVWTVKNDQVYLVSYHALQDEFDQYLDYANAFVDSFKIS